MLTTTTTTHINKINRRGKSFADLFSFRSSNRTKPKTVEKAQKRKKEKKNCGKRETEKKNTLKNKGESRHHRRHRSVTAFAAVAASLTGHS